MAGGRADTVGGMHISVDDFLLFSRRTIDGYIEAIAGLDDHQINAAPELPGANSPYQLVVHALGACAWWTAHMVCGHPSERDRSAEFEATGTVADAQARLRTAADALEVLRPELIAAAEVQGTPSTTKPLGVPWTVGACLIHAYEELAQHLGHLEVTVDIVTATSRPSTPAPQPTDR